VLTSAKPNYNSMARKYNKELEVTVLILVAQQYNQGRYIWFLTLIIIYLYNPRSDYTEQ